MKVFLSDEMASLKHIGFTQAFEGDSVLLWSWGVSFCHVLGFEQGALHRLHLGLTSLVLVFPPIPRCQVLLGSQAHRP